MSKGKNAYVNDLLLKKKIVQLSDDLSAAKGDGLSVEKLKKEHNFFEYIKMLKKFAKRYIVIMAASDTPCGVAYTKEVSKQLMDIGLEVDLAGRFRYAYGALIDAGVLVFEEIGATIEDIVEYETNLDENEIKISSVCFNAPKSNMGLIAINGKNYSPSMRGLNFVVYDKVTKFVLDAVNFDTYSDNFPCHRPSEITEGVQNFCEKHPDVTFVCFNRPGFPQENLTENERFIVANAIGRATILNNLDKPVFAIQRYYDRDGIVEVLNAPKSYHDVNGVRRFEDICGRYVNTAGGHRITTNQPLHHQRTIFVLGGCHIFGVGASDEHTIASFLQKLFNQNLPEQGIIVQNYGFYLMEMGDAQTGEELSILESLPVKSGDIVLWNFGIVPKLPYIDMSNAAMYPRPYEVFSDTMHCTPDGYRLIAQKLFEGLQEKNFLQYHALDSVKGANAYGFDNEKSNELTEYKKILLEFYDEMFSMTMGAIVMNCNPFTLGHRYLIEQALQQCDYLAIFVVQEDQSIFPFDDRLRLVDEGVADLKNVVVIPSGRFIISSLTFSEYFNKSKIQDRTVDTSLDVTIFAREIAPCLHITKRFVGEEPFDAVTRQYNENMKRILPEYGIELIEIPRQTDGEEVISASRVRALLEKKDFEGIEKLVPKSTYEYLVENYSI